MARLIPRRTRLDPAGGFGIRPAHSSMAGGYEPAAVPYSYDRIIEMPDDSTTVAELKDAVRRFAAARLWEPYHAPKNLVMALACETAELTEHFLWLSAEESRRAVDDPRKREEIADELADVAGVLLNLSLTLGIDLSDAIRAKMIKNERKYPAEVCAARERAKRGPLEAT